MCICRSIEELYDTMIVVDYRKLIADNKEAVKLQRQLADEEREALLHQLTEDAKVDAKRALVDTTKTQVGLDASLVEEEKRNNRKLSFF